MLFRLYDYADLHRSCKSAFVHFYTCKSSVNQSFTALAEYISDSLYKLFQGLLLLLYNKVIIDADFYYCLYFFV